MKKRNLCIQTMVFEVTRKCNMACAHCLRGDDQNIDLTDDIIDIALKDVTYISTLVFSGGEPGLNVPAIQHTLEYCQQHNIYVNNFFIATNGKIITNEFLKAVYAWYLYTAENNYDIESAMIMLSEDEWHGKINPKNKTKLAGFSFYQNEKRTEFLINEGRARNINSSKKRENYDYTSLLSNPDNKTKEMCQSYIEYDILPTESGQIEQLTIDEPEVYISANGDVKLGCDNSYNNIINYIGRLTPTRTLFDMLYFIYQEDESENNDHKKFYKMIQSQKNNERIVINLTDKSKIIVKINDEGQCTYLHDKNDKSKLRQLITSDTKHDTLPEIAHTCAILNQELEAIYG